MTVYLIRAKLDGKFTKDYWIIKKENRTEVRHWIINTLVITESIEYDIDDISGYPAIQNFKGSN